MFFEQGEFERAEKVYRQVLKLDQDDPLAMSNLGVVLVELEKYQQAVTKYRRAIELDSENLDAYLGLANAYYLGGMLHKASVVYSYRKTNSW